MNRKMLTAEEAWDRLVPHLQPAQAESVARTAALGRVLAEPLYATRDLPACNVSAMDGYAVRGKLHAGDFRRVVATVAAGDPPGFKLNDDAVARIMTGAPIPVGADRVVPVENTDGGVRQVRFHCQANRGDFIRQRGEIVRRGDLLLERGSLLTPGALASLASHGHRHLSVVSRPGVAALITGDEIVPPDTEPGPGQLRDSHTDFLLAAGRLLGLEVTPLGIAPDRVEPLTEMIRQGLDYHVLLLCGGVSMGEFDLVEKVLQNLGCHLLFDQVAIQPGKPTVAARTTRGLAFGLPGNPASAMVSFWLFVRPALRRLMGLEDGFWYGCLEGVLAAPLPGAKARDRFLPAEVEFRDGEVRVAPILPKGSHDVAAFARGTALVRIAAGATPLSAGEGCQILPLADWRVARGGG